MHTARQYPKASQCPPGMSGSAQADAELFSEMDRRYGKMSTPELGSRSTSDLVARLAICKNQALASSTAMAAAALGLLYPMKVPRQVGEERLRLGVYMKMRRDRDTAGSGISRSRSSQPTTGAAPRAQRDYHAAKRRLFSGEMEFSEFQAMSRSALDNALLRAELEKKPSRI